jgi:hypothetical protein
MKRTIGVIIAVVILWVTAVGASVGIGRVLDNESSTETTVGWAASQCATSQQMVSLLSGRCQLLSKSHTVEAQAAACTTMAELQIAIATNCP